MSTELGRPPTERPVAGTWVIDSVHSVVTFTVEHFTVAFARGIAAGPTGTITVGDDPADSAVTASIDASTLTTANPIRDQKILGPDVLEVERHPTIDFASTAFRPAAGSGGALEGELTLHGVTRPVTLEVDAHGVVTDVWGKQRLGMTVAGTIRRSDFGVGEWGHVPLSAGGFMVPDTVTVTMEIEATLDEPEPPAAP